MFKKYNFTFILVPFVAGNAILVIRLPGPYRAPKNNLTPSSCGTAPLHSDGDEQQPAQV